MALQAEGMVNMKKTQILSQTPPTSASKLTPTTESGVVPEQY